jgi:nucleoside-diphosphate-sugar epimerase
MTDTFSHSPIHLLVCGSGYLGAELAQRARNAGHAVSACSLSGGNGSHVCDLSSAHSVAMLAELIDPPDVVVHCASSGRGGAPAYERVYRDGVSHLSHIFPDAVLLYTSSSSVYGQCDGSVITEESAAEPDRDTGRVLREAEEIVRQARGIVCRLSGIYGPERSMILKKFLQGEAVIEEDGRRFLNQIHRDDAVDAILLLASLALQEKHSHLVRGEIFNVSDSQPLTQLLAYETLARTFDRPLPPSGPRDLNRKRGWTHKQVSNAKLRALGWSPRYPSFLDAIHDIYPTIAIDA